jgi:hypothetical protein
MPKKPKKKPFDEVQSAWEVVGAAIGQPLVKPKRITFRPPKQMQSRKKTTSNKVGRIRSR